MDFLSFRRNVTVRLAASSIPEPSFCYELRLTGQSTDNGGHTSDLINSRLVVDCIDRKGGIMGTPNQLPARLTFGPFEVNASTGELKKGGIPVRLPAQPFAILVLLLQRCGELVTRQQLREQIWGEGTFVDFEHGLNAAMNKLRRALGDSAENPRYIETLPGRGYRFVGTLDCGQVAPVSLLPRPESREQDHPRLWRSIAR